MTKALIFDSGTLINLSMNGLLYILEHLKRNFPGKFLITKSVKYEIVDRPMGIKRFELGAIRIQNLLDAGILEFPESIGVSDEQLQKETRELMEAANHFMQYKGSFMSIVSEAEISCLALYNQLEKNGVECMIGMDERTTRILSENPESLTKMMSEKMHMNIKRAARNPRIFPNYKFIRSTELVFVAYKKGIINIHGKNVLDALLYATKFKGSSISFEEIEELKKV